MKALGPGLFSTLIIICYILAFSCKPPAVLVTQEQQKGDMYSNQHDYAQAVVHYKNCLNASAMLGIYRNLDMEASICRKISHSYSVQGNYDEALKYTYQALKSDSIRNNNKIEVIKDYRTLGQILFYKGDFNAGILLLNKALTLNEGMESSLKGVNQQSVADTYLSLAEANAVFGRYNETIRYCLLALKIYDSLKDWQGELEGYLILGNADISMGDYKTGIVRIEKSMALASEHELSTSRHHQALGEAFASMGEFEKALGQKLKALEAAESSKILPAIIWSNIGVGDAYYDIGDYIKSNQFFETALKLQSESPTQARALEASTGMRLGDIDKARKFYSEIKAGVASGIASLRLADMYSLSGRQDSAIVYFSEALKYFTESGIKEGMAKSHLGLAMQYASLNSVERANQYFEKSMELTTNDETRWQIWFNKGLLLEKDGKPKEAIEAMRKAVEIIENIRGRFTIDEFKSKYIDNKVKVYDRLIKLLLSNGRMEEAFNYSERARSRAFLDLIGSKKIAIKPEADSSLLRKEQELRFQIQILVQQLQKSDLQVSRGVTEDQVIEELRSSREEYQDLLRRIKLENKDYASMVAVEPIQYTDIQKKIDPKTIIVNYWVGENDLIVWMLNKEKLLTFVLDANEKEVWEVVKNSRTLVNRTSEFTAKNPSDNKNIQGVPDEFSAKAQFRKAYDMLISPIEKQLKGYKNICIIPHGPLHLLPFQALIAPDNSFLIEKYDIFYAPSISVYERCIDKKNHAEKEFLAMALGNLSLGEFSALPGTRWEVEKISALFPEATVRYENQSTESFAKENAGIYNIVHFSTHGMLDKRQPMFSFVLFAPSPKDDGLLTVNEVFGLVINAKLVTLSACETGLGEISHGDEIVGLSRAFIYAGTPSIVVSLWSVADQPTALLMAKFYEYQKKFSLVESLSMAQREVLKEFKAPFYWAPFQLIGKGE